VDAARGHLRLPVLAALGSVASGLSEASVSCADADRVLDTMGRDRRTAGPVAAFADVRPQVLLSEIADFLAGRSRAAEDPGLRALAGYDDQHGAVLLPSLTAYLDALGDVRRAADGLGVHPNTLRYRVRRCLELSGLDLGDPDQRLLAQLQLRAMRRARDRRAAASGRTVAGPCSPAPGEGLTCGSG
jgi:DNA-binding PucR family transcriptional regulator